MYTLNEALFLSCFSLDVTGHLPQFSRCRRKTTISSDWVTSHQLARSVGDLAHTSAWSGYFAVRMGFGEPVGDAMLLCDGDAFPAPHARAVIVKELSNILIASRRMLL